MAAEDERFFGACLLGGPTTMETGLFPFGTAAVERISSHCPQRRFVDRLSLSRTRGYRIPGIIIIIVTEHRRGVHRCPKLTVDGVANRETPLPPPTTTGPLTSDDEFADLFGRVYTFFFSLFR